MELLVTPEPSNIDISSILSTPFNWKECVREPKAIQASSFAIDTKLFFYMFTEQAEPENRDY